MTVVETIAAPVATPSRNRETHVPRDELERPLVGLCGYVARDPSKGPRNSLPGEWASCVVCDDLWKAGVRPKNWGRG